MSKQQEETPMATWKKILMTPVIIVAATICITVGIIYAIRIGVMYVLPTVLIIAALILILPV